ncbi:MAG: 50S ribosomal protein L2 [Candidatus Aenigmatarchaeota archaeon]|nr:MAG: 50S ribosomal protein L2 [Candidatus Aenigmarchaeota archaeon]
MGKPIIAQRRGKGSPTFRVPEYHFQPKLEFKNMDGTVLDLVNHPAKLVPLAKIRWDDSSIGWLPAPEGIKVGDRIATYLKPLSEIPVGSKIFAIETRPNSGPKLCRASSAILFSKEREFCIIKLPSRKDKYLHPQCRALIGNPAADGRKEKPWLKAGKKLIAMRRRGKLYPRTSANKMNAVDHPFGGKSGVGRPKTVSRNAPPGAKVGSIAARRTGKRKR